MYTYAIDPCSQVSSTYKITSVERYIVCAHTPQVSAWSAFLVAKKPLLMNNERENLLDHLRMLRI